MHWACVQDTCCHHSFRHAPWLATLSAPESIINDAISGRIPTPPKKYTHTRSGTCYTYKLVSWCTQATAGPCSDFITSSQGMCRIKHSGYGFHLPCPENADLSLGFFGFQSHPPAVGLSPKSIWTSPPCRLSEEVCKTDINKSCFRICGSWPTY